MNNPCEWCKSTSEQIDSLEFEVEKLKVRSVNNFCKINGLVKELEAKDKLTVKLKSALLVIQKQCELDGHITKGVISGICYKALGNGEQSDLLTTTDKG